MLRPIRAVCLLLAISAVAACSESPDEVARHPVNPAIAGAKLPPILSRQELFGESHSPYGWRISAAGDQLAWIAPQEEGHAVLQIEMLATGETRSIALPFRPDDLGWGPDGVRLFLVADEDGNQTYHTFMIETTQPDPVPVDLSPSPDVTVRLEQYAGDDLLISHNGRDTTLMDVYRRNPVTGAEDLVARNPGTVRDWHAVRGQGLFARTRSVGDGSRAIDIRDGDTWQERMRLGVEETFDFVGGQIDDGKVLALSNRGRDKVALVRFDLGTGAEEMVHADPEADIEWVWYAGADSKPLLAKTYLGRTSSHFFDPDLGAELEELTGDDPRAATSIEDLDVAARLVVVRVYSDRGRSEFWLIDRQTGQHRLLYADPRGQTPERFATTEPFSFTARDGLLVHGYITRPPGTDGRRLPAVLWVHGGPFARSYWGFDPMAQFLANRGYAVIDVNFRGSTGYGKAFLAAADGEFARKMHWDLIDALDWADREGLIDPRKVAIGGASYGGWAALVGLVASPERFVAGISINGPSDLPSLVTWLAPEPNIWTAYAGDPADPVEYAEMAARSPLRQANRIDDPVLLIHAVRDSRVPIDHSIRMAAQLQTLDRPVETLWVPCEGHMLTSPAEFVKVAERVDWFLAGYLGGRVSRH